MIRIIVYFFIAYTVVALERPSHSNAVTTGPTTAEITNSTVQFTTTLFNSDGSLSYAGLYVEMDATWTI